MTERKKIILYNDVKLVVVSMLTALICCICAFSLKWTTEHFQHELYSFAVKTNGIWFVVFPTCGITTIYFLRKYLFRNRKNKGITEIYKTLDQRKDHLPLFKVPSHLLNGFFTVVFGGSTGIEVSTVVATATVGNEAYKRDFSAKMYKRELVSAGVVASMASVGDPQPRYRCGGGPAAYGGFQDDWGGQDSPGGKGRALALRHVRRMRRRSPARRGGKGRALALRRGGSAKGFGPA